MYLQQKELLKIDHTELFWQKSVLTSIFNNKHVCNFSEEEGEEDNKSGLLKMWMGTHFKLQRVTLHSNFLVFLLLKFCYLWRLFKNVGDSMVWQQQFWFLTIINIFCFIKTNTKKSGLSIWCLWTKYQAEYFKYKVNGRFRGPHEYVSQIFHLNSRIRRRNSIYLSVEHLVKLLPILSFFCWNSIRWKLTVLKSNFCLNSWCQTHFKILSSIYFTFLKSFWKQKHS